MDSMNNFVGSQAAHSLASRETFTSSGGDDFTDAEGPSTMGLDANLTNTPSRERTIIAICTAGNRCGCAVYYDSTVHLIADRRDSGDPYKGLDIVIQRIDPDVVIVAAVQKKLILFLEKIFCFKVFDISRNEKPTSEDTNSAFILAIVPNNWFAISHGEQKLIESDWAKNSNSNDLEQKSLFVFSKVKKSVDVCAVRAISALDKYVTHEFTMDCSADAQVVPAALDSSLNRQIKMVQSQLSQVTKTTDPETRVADCLMPILDVRYIDPGPVLSIDKSTFQTLGIFSSTKKEAQRGQIIIEDSEMSSVPSLYDILNQCQSLQGRKMLHTMMMWPLQELDELQHRHETVDFFLRPENKLFRDQLAVQMRGIVPLSNILAKLNQSVGSYYELSTVYKSLWAFVSMIDLIKASSGTGTELEIFNRITSLDSASFRATVDSIVSVVDFEASKREQRIQVQLGVDQHVDEKREIVRNLMKFCDEVAIEETAKYKDILGKTCRVLYVPRIGFLNSIDYTSTAELTQISINKEFEILLHTEQSVYFKTKRMEELDNNAGDIACDLIDVQESVVSNLQQDILQHTETILRLMERFGELDVLLSFANVSSQRGYTRPEFVPIEAGIDICDAFHPLLGTKYNVVPNDVKFYKNNDERLVKVMIITGPNSCGKTTYMKAVCLVVYMAHIGCFVPAIHARLPIVDAILTRMHSANSISTGLSSFATDLHQINYALERATDRSLIAIDEFGKGTQARDGFHLLKGLVAYFATRGQNSSHVMVATHYNRLVNHLQNYFEHILYKTFKVVRDPAKGTVVYEFKLTDGVSESSLADQVAAKAGIPNSIIERANQIKDHIIDGRPIQPRPSAAA